ncbi:MAG: hypothetical protein IKE15_11445 [Clostridia bacterium]|nr:hypothetical protein [Clostridia bacterium]
MCKTNDIICTKVQDLMDLNSMIEELQNEAEKLKDEIKAYMGSEETMQAGCWKVTWKETISRRVDTAALKKVLGDALEEYTKTIISRPFKVS